MWHKLKTIQADYQDDVKKDKIFDSAAYILQLIEDTKKDLVKLGNSTETISISENLDYIITQANLIKTLSQETEEDFY